MATKIKDVTLEKIEFKNLPDTTTPISATNMNELQNNTQKAIDKLELTDEDIINALFNVVDEW